MRRVYPRPRRCGHSDSGDGADGHDSTDPTAVPAVLEKKDTQKGGNAGLHIRHEEVESLQGPPWARFRNLS
ncbi:MAG TPA: hypothetical protein VI653_03170 [Steroidobacteraceae bacterium]